MERAGDGERTAVTLSEGVLDLAPEAIVTVDADGELVYLNRAAEEMFALQRGSTTGRLGLGDLFDGQQELLTRLGERREMRGLRSDGARFPLAVTMIRSDDAPPLYTAFVRDLSASKEDERKRTRMERLLNDAEELASTGSFEVDLRTHELTWSHSLHRLYGYRPGEVEVTLEHMLARTHPNEQREFRARSAQMLASPYRATREYRIQLDDGSIRHLIAKNEIERDEDDEPVRMFGVVQDVTDLRREQQRRARMQRLLETAERMTGMGSYELDLRTAELIWSDELYRLHGFDPGQVEPSLELAMRRMHPDDRTAIESRTTEMFASPRPMTAEYRIHLDDRTVRHVVADGVVERDENGEPVRLFGTVQDVTEQRLTERELQAHHALTQALSEWQGFEPGVVDLLRRLGTTMDWDAASIWVRADRGDELVCRAFWAPRAAAVEEFEQALRDSELPPGEGAVRRAWDLMEPIGIIDASTDLPASDRAEILKAGLRSVLFFPAVHDGETLAVLAFYGREPRRLTARLIRTLSYLGHDLGRFLVQRRAEIGFRPLSARELEVLQLAARGVSGPMIAERLGIGPATVKTHFERTYAKLGVSDRTAAVAAAMRHGLIT